MKQLNKIAGASLLIAGTSIGAGMLALPISAGAAGFYNTLFLFVLSWLLMMFTAFLFMEVYFWVDEEINMTTAAKMTLGRAGEWIVSITFFLLLVSINSAYITGATELFTSLVPNFSATVSEPVAAAVFTTFVGALIYFGTGPVDFINRFMMIGLFGSYATLVFLSIPDIDISYYSQGSAKFLAYSWPIVVTSFAYQFVIPSVKTYLNNEVKPLTCAIVIGTLIPLAFFLVWVGVILGVIPYEGSEGISGLLSSDKKVAGLSDALLVKLGSPIVPTAVRFFSIFALITSLLGVSLSLCDYFMDFFRQAVSPKFNSRITVTILALLPAYLFAVAYPDGFLIALRYAAIFVAILLGVLPVMMVWSGRYCKGLAKPGSFRVPGGKVSLVIAFLLSVSVIVFEMMMRFDLLPLPA